MSDENLINSQNSVSTPTHKNLKDNLATLGQVKNVTDKIIKTANIDREQITKNKEDIGKIQEDLDCKIDKVAVGERELKFTNIGYVNASDGTISRSKEA